nr:flagellar hook capping protein [Lachnospiraceae bacterium]
MSLVQEISNGEVLSDKTKTSSSTTTSSTDSTKEMFLQLLVTEMQYQDPLEPTDNSQYVQQMATFSQVEALNTMSDKMSNLQAGSLVGNYVTITNEDGSVVEG